MPKKQQEYGNETIRQLKGADRVRKRPAVIFGSDGVEGCAHSIFEIVSNSIDEARDGHGNRINVTLFPEHVVEVEDFGRGIPVDYNKVEARWNWELIFCELYAGGKYGEGSGNYDFSDIAARYPDRFRLQLGFNPDLAHKIYAGSDIFLMPSKSEPCGLSQMVALRYGTLPIVRETGGLKDSITDCGDGEGNGFTFKTYDAYDMLW